MAQDFRIPPTGFGPGSQPATGAELDFMPLPKEMTTFEPRIVEVADVAAVRPALRLMRRVARACERAAGEGEAEVFVLSELDPRNRALVTDTLGEGEVSCAVSGSRPLKAQESVFAGVWSVSGDGPDRIEVGPAPAAAMHRAFEPTRRAGGLHAHRAEGVVNAPSIVAELLEAAEAWRAGDDPHVVNLSLLPHTPEDLEHFESALGAGAAALLSRGYGDCRVEATAVPRLWRVRFYNSMGVLILDTFEVCAMPEVARAAREDFEDSGARLDEVLEAIR